MTGEAPYTVPKEPGRWRAILLAAMVHLALLTFLWVGIHWKSDTPATVEAEVWDPQPREAAPLPQPANEPPPQPEVKTPPPPPPPVVEKPVEKPIAKPDIALEQEKKRKEQERKKREEEEQRLAKLKEQKEREQKLAEQKLAAQKLAEQKLAQQKKLEQEKLDKQKAEKAAQEKKLAEDKKRKQDEAYNQMLAKMRTDEMKRITGITGTGGTGAAPKSQGPRGDGNYKSQLEGKIRSNINFAIPEGLEGNPAVEFEIRLLPDGSIAGVRKLKSSGVPGFDEAVARAIDKSQPFPKDKNGTVPSSLISTHKPKDQ